MKPFAGIGIALFLLVSIGGEALMTVRIFRHELSVTTLPAKLPTAESELAAPPRLASSWTLTRPSGQSTCGRSSLAARPGSPSTIMTNLQEWAANQ